MHWHLQYLSQAIQNCPFILNPQKPRYTYIWDISVIFIYLKKLGDISNLERPYREISYFIGLISRTKITVISCKLYRSSERLMHNLSYCNKLLKHTRPGRKMDTFIFNECAQEPMLCKIQTLNGHLNRRKKLVKTNVSSLFFTCGKQIYSNPTAVYQLPQGCPWKKC